MDTPRELSSTPRKELSKDLAKLNPRQRGVQILLLFCYIIIAIEQNENSKQHALSRKNDQKVYSEQNSYSLDNIQIVSLRIKDVRTIQI